MKGILAILCVICLSATQALAQATPTATANDEFAIILPTTTPLNATYKIDMSAYESNMPDPAKAITFLASFNKPHVSQSFDFATKELTITLDTTNGATTGWTVFEWNILLGAFHNIE